MGGRVLDFNLVCACIVRHENLTPAMVTQDIQLFITKQHIATRTIQLIIPTNVITEIDNVDQIHHRKTSPASLYATSRAAINLV